MRRSEDEPDNRFYPLSKPIVDITLDTRFEDIPDAGPCEVCNGPTQKTFLEHVITGADVRIRARKVAGYQCQDPECGIPAYSNEAFVESLTRTSVILANNGDMAMAAAFGRRIEFENQIIAKRHLAEPPQAIPVVP